jgi:hypothetical protein
VDGLILLALVTAANLGPSQSWTSPSGVTVTYLSMSHKHAVDGDTLGIWTLRFAKEGSKTFETDVRGSYAEAEIPAHGQLFLINSTKVAGRLRVTEQTLAKKLSEDKAREMAEKLAGDVKFRGSRMSEENGVYAITLYDKEKDVFHTRIGAYTKRSLSVKTINPSINQTMKTE